MKAIDTMRHPHVFNRRRSAQTARLCTLHPRGHKHSRNASDNRVEPYRNHNKRNILSGMSTRHCTRTAHLHTLHLNINLIGHCFVCGQNKKGNNAVKTAKIIINSNNVCVCVCARETVVGGAHSSKRRTNRTRGHTHKIDAQKQPQ